MLPGKAIEKFHWEMIKKIQKNSYEYIIQEQRALIFYLENLHCLISFIFL